ncbi:MAG: helix-turn-helix domain-containing protein [Firmicutes bacterium]|nr:helix-turn-helix domain-containing protein [Bacillota bacterium]
MDYTANICLLASQIESGIKTKTDYNQLEKAISYSHIHIRDIFQKTTDIPLARYILARKIANAAFEIRHTNKSITEIALDYGFSNPETFARAFRRYTGMTPSAFRKSEHVCGRRVICPGVYAPTILTIDNPIFTLRHVKEVNEMSEMIKTEDSCVLYGVPKVYFGREVDGQQQNRPFPMCLQSVLNYMGQNIGYTQLMAYCGTAFRQRWDSNGWNIAINDIRFTYEHHLKAFELGFKGAGRNYAISESFTKGITKKDAFTLIKTEIDCGRPVIALGVVGPPEASIITGYRNNGDTVLGWSLFQDFWGGCSFDESGYFVKNDWWHYDFTQGMMSVGEETANPTSDNDVLENALMLMTTGEVATYSGNDIFYGGQTAYEAWALALEDEHFTGNVNDEQIDAEGMLAERFYAAAFMELMAQKYSDNAEKFNECARLLKTTADYAPQIATLREKHGLNNPETRKQMATLIRKAAEQEKAACIFLAEILDRTQEQIRAMEQEMTGHTDEAYWKFQDIQERRQRDKKWEADKSNDQDRYKLAWDESCERDLKKAFATHLVDKKKKQPVIDQFTGLLDWLLSELGGDSPSPEAIKAFMYKQYYGVEAIKASERFMREFTAFCAKNSPLFSDALNEFNNRYWADLARQAATDRKQLIVPIPPETKIDPARLERSGLTNQEYVEAFAALQGAIISVYQDIERSPAEWWNDCNVINVLDCMCIGASHAEDDVLIVDREHYEMQDRIKERSKGSINQIVKGFSSMGFVFENFEGKTPTFKVRYPDTPNLITVLSEYFTMLPTGCTKCGDICPGNWHCYNAWWHNNSTFSYRYVEDPAAQAMDRDFLVRVDWLPDEVGKGRYWLHDELTKLGFTFGGGQTSTTGMMYKKGGKMLLVHSGSDKTYQEKFHMAPGTLNYKLAIKFPIKNIFQTHPKIAEEFMHNFPRVFDVARCKNCWEGCRNKATLAAMDKNHVFCGANYFYFCDPILEEAKEILKIWKLENNIKPPKK